MTELDRAVLTFAQGFVRQRSQARPYEMVETDELIILRDPPGTCDPRLTEIVVHNQDWEEAKAKVDAMGLSSYAISVVHGEATEEKPVRAFWKAAGYRSLRREPFFVAEPTEWASDRHEVRRVTTPAEAEAIFAAAGKHQIKAENLADDTCRLYAAWDEGEAIGWVKSIETDYDGWVGNLYVVEAHRRKGVGEALMRALLDGDAKRGLATSTLLASSDGSRLYPRLGYRQIGMLQIFSPLKSP